MKFSKIVAAISLVVGTGVASADDVDKMNEKNIKREATKGSAEDNSRACKASEVFFKFDSAALAPDDATVLQPLVDELTKFEGTTIVLDGHADPRGTDAYNVILSGKRSDAVREKLISMGAPKDRIVLGLYGEKGDRRDSYPEDRRVTAWVTRNTTAQIIDHQLENGATALVWGDQMQNLAALGGEEVIVEEEVEVDVEDEG